MTVNEKRLLDMERRFKRVANLTQDISSFPLSAKIANIEINKEKSKEFSEVFTPLWLVDRMIKQVDFEQANTTTLDLCAGYGQFSIRLIRYLFKTFPGFDVVKFIRDNHAFSELQLSSCYKLFSIFGKDITLFIGDSTQLNKLPPDAKGIWCYVESYGYWACLTKTVQDILLPKGIKFNPISEEKFVFKIESLIRELNEAYAKTKEMYNSTLKQMTNQPKQRLEMISKINAATENLSLQSVNTPQSVISDMLECVDDLEKKSILVMFNCEIVEQLIHKYKVDPNSITFATDFGSGLKAKAMQKMYGVSDTFLFSNKAEFLHASFKGRKFDVCLSNPPYNRGLDLKILQAIMGGGTVETSIAKEFVIVHPSTWLLDQKGKSDSFNNIKALLNKKLRSVKFFNGNAVFGVGLFVPCVITHIDLFHASDTNVVFFNEKFKVNDIENITKFGKMWEPLIKPFMKKIQKSIATFGHVWAHNTRTIDKSKVYCQTAAILGNHSKDPSVLIKDDFYSMTIRGSSANEGIREPRLNKPGGATPTFGFDSVAERDNFLRYLNTDFARFCLALYKIGQHMENGEMELIPWLDFTQSWDDDKLFKHFDVDQKTQDYIRKFLPDYYGIRK